MPHVLTVMYQHFGGHSAAIFRMSGYLLILSGCCDRCRTYIISSSVELIYIPNMSTESRAYTTIIIWRRGGGNDPPRASNPCNSFQGCSAHLCTDPSEFLVRAVGLEPTILPAQDFKSCVYIQFHHARILFWSV